jgi:hypothetical protein
MKSFLFQGNTYNKNLFSLTALFYEFQNISFQRSTLTGCMVLNCLSGEGGAAPSFVQAIIATGRIVLPENSCCKKQD